MPEFPSASQADTRKQTAARAGHEPGNVYYDLYRSRKADRTYVVTERYRDEAAFQSRQTSVNGLPQEVVANWDRLAPPVKIASSI